jgi:hypothetical protein
VVVITSTHHDEDFSTTCRQPSCHTKSWYVVPPYFTEPLHCSRMPSSFCICVGRTQQNTLSSF